MNRTLLRQSFLVFLYAASLVLFGISVYTRSLVFALLGLPFFAVTVSILHEFGHALGCGLQKGKLTRIQTALFSLENRRLRIHENPCFSGYCGFIKSENDALIYLFGPLASAVCFGLCLVWLLLTLPNPAALLYTAVSGVHLLKNCLPFGHHDLHLFVKEMKKGASKL